MKMNLARMNNSAPRINRLQRSRKNLPRLPMYLL